MCDKKTQLAVGIWSKNCLSLPLGMLMGRNRGWCFRFMVLYIVAAVGEMLMDCI